MFDDLLTWWDGADTSGKSMVIDGPNNDLVIWKDKSGNGYHLHHSTGSQRPGVNARTIGNKHCPNFVPQNSLRNWSVPLAAPISMFAVVMFDTTGAFHTICGGASSGTQPLWRISDSNTVTLQRTSNGLGTGSGLGAIAAGVPYVLGVTVDDTFAHFYRPNRRDMNNAHGQTLTGSASIQVGANNDLSYMDGGLAELILYPSMLDPNDAVRVIDHLSYKWGSVNP